MDVMMSGAMNGAFEAAAEQFFRLMLTGAVCAMLLMTVACFTAGILRRLR